MRLGQPGVGYPRYVAGERAAPPENCGGLPGFYAAFDALADPNHLDHANAAECFQDYDPERFTELAFKLAFGNLAKRGRAGTLAPTSQLSPDVGAETAFTMEQGRRSLISNTVRR